MPRFISIARSVSLCWLLYAQLAVARFCVYIDEYHSKMLPNNTLTSHIDCGIMAFANSSLFTTRPAGEYKPFIPVADIRKRLAPNATVLIAIGGWGDTAGFSKGAANADSRDEYARNVADMLYKHGFDGVDIDWEYPGGNGEDYKINPNEKKRGEIETFPQLLASIRRAIRDKILSIAVPGREVDMIAYTKQQAPKIWQSVDFVNVMTYDLMNRRENVTKHHSDFEGSLKTVNKYICLGLQPSKINLGFAFYAKWFTTAPGANCTATPVGCKVVPMERVEGSDNGNSGAVTFEKANMVPPPANLTESMDGECGYAFGKKCSKGMCCSQFGNCGNSTDHCGMQCLPGYGECHNVTVLGSWSRAVQNGRTDPKGGGQYFFDSSANLFWTWDTPELMVKKYKEIVKAKNLGGIMAWSLGEDSSDWSRLTALAEMLKDSEDTCHSS